MAARGSLVLEARGGPYAEVALPPADLVVLLDVDAAAVALRRGRPVVALASTKEDADAMHAALSDQTDRPVAPPRVFRSAAGAARRRRRAGGGASREPPGRRGGGAYLVLSDPSPRCPMATAPRGPAGPPRVLVSAGRSGRCEAEGNIISVGARSSRAAHTPPSSGSSGRDSLDGVGLPVVSNVRVELAGDGAGLGGLSVREIVPMTRAPPA